ncbi:alpha/beta fold hydrolase [uncultured Treponema sp.]|uniref:alpha/beta fold hydrolase n=1 Tax=uncultured Treponema sp. TaxID=162155 RepID=UPI0026198CC2|nr:alpha/beta fold hydrolase [uncultured Treponema sp.]
MKLNKIGLAAFIVIAFFVLVMLFVVFLRFRNRCKIKIDGKNGVQESFFLDIGGMKQYVQIRGENVENPVMIFVHGGPASPMGYVSAYYQKELESALTIINYDQRGCGRTYYANGCDSECNIDLLVSDLDAIVEYAKKRFGKNKVIIAAHSWGTVIGSIYVQKNPQNVSCYVGISQITNLYKNKLNVARTALEKDEIKGTKDEKELSAVIERMEKVKNYDDMSISDLSRLVAISKKYLAGKGDYSVCQKDAQIYYEKITAPDKAFYWIENAGHSMFMDSPNRYCEVIKEILGKLKYSE